MRRFPRVAVHTRACILRAHRCLQLSYPWPCRPHLTLQYMNLYELFHARASMHRQVGVAAVWVLCTAGAGC